MSEEEVQALLADCMEGLLNRIEHLEREVEYLKAQHRKRTSLGTIYGMKNQ